MINIEEAMVSRLAANNSAFINAKKISSQNKFTKLFKTEDETLIFGDCKGSGSSVYHTSADFTDPANPVFRCSCPSRQFPCKHGLAILLEWIANKPFEIADVPEDIAQKRIKQEVKKEKTTENASKPKKTNSSAQLKKMKKQLEGIEIVRQFIKEVTNLGVSGLGGSNLSAYESLAKQVGDYYLSAPQSIIYQIIACANSKNQINYNEIVSLLSKLNNICNKAEVFLNSKIKNKDASLENSLVYNYLGTVWKTEQLKELGLCKNNVELIQLSFDVITNSISKNYIDTGFWINLLDGEISKTLNIRPFKATRYITQDDTMFNKITTNECCYYPGETNKRIRFDINSENKVTIDDIQKIKSFAENDLKNAVKIFKSQIKNNLSEQKVGILINFDSIGTSEDKIILTDKCGNSIELLSPIGFTNTILNIKLLSKNLIENCTMFGQLFFNPDTNTIYLYPNSIVTDSQIIRLLY